MKRSEVDFDDELRSEYDLSKLKNQVRGKYAEAHRKGINLVLIEPDLFDVVPSAEAVNKALRSLLNKYPRDPDGERIKK